MLPIIWLLGTSGVGKSTVGYRLLSHLGAAGVTAAFVDADQLRLVSAVQATQTDLIGAALPTMSDNYAAHGARALVVAGVLDDADHLTRLLPATSRSRVLAVALEADDDTIRERVHRRGWLTGLADAAVDHAARIDPEFADLRLDTTDRSPGELAGRLTDVAVAHIRRSGWRAAERTPQQAAGPTPPRMVVVTGPGGVGVSTAGFRTFSLLAHDGERVGYVDAHQLGLLGTEVRSDRLAPPAGRQYPHGHPMSGTRRGGHRRCQRRPAHRPAPGWHAASGARRVRPDDAVLVGRLGSRPRRSADRASPRPRPRAPGRPPGWALR